MRCSPVASLRASLSIAQEYSPFNRCLLCRFARELLKRGLLDVSTIDFGRPDHRARRLQVAVICIEVVEEVHPNIATGRQCVVKTSAGSRALAATESTCVQCPTHDDFAGHCTEDPEIIYFEVATHRTGKKKAID